MNYSEVEMAESDFGASYKICVMLRSFLRKKQDAQIRRKKAGVDLYKTLFTVSALTEAGEVIFQEQYHTIPEGYFEFLGENNEYWIIGF